jgi:hypothetical protein
MASLDEVKSVFWNMTAKALKGKISEKMTEHPERWIRKMYPKNGAPDWKVDDNIVFLNLDQRDDDYAKQRDSIYKSEQGTIMRHAMRTRVWDLTVNAYGPRAYEMTAAMQDGVFLQSVKRYLAQYGIYLVPYMQPQVQSSEIFAGQWWERWNITLTFNESYSTSEDAGSIETVSIRAEALR